MGSRNPLAGGRWTFAFIAVALLALAAAERPSLFPAGRAFAPGEAGVERRAEEHCTWTG